MKKYLLYTVLFAITALSACKKGVEPLGGQTPEQRVAATLNAYSTALTSAPNGWKAFLFPEGGSVYLFSMKFSTSNRVTMVADYGTSTSGTPLESSYKLRQQLSPSLLFDTYSYIHMLADPDPSVFGGVAGAGNYSDFEFGFESMSGDTIKLIGNKLGSKLWLVKAASATEYTSFTTGTADIVAKFSQLRTYFKRGTVGTTDCEVRVNPSSKLITFSYLTGTTLTSATSLFYVDGSTSTMVLMTPIQIGTTTVTTIKGVTFDATNRILGGTINGTAFQLREAIAPLSYDLTAARKFYDTPYNGAYWSSTTGTTVDGIVDGYKVGTIPGWSFLLFYPKYNAAYSRLGYIINGAYGAYGPAPIASFPANGRLVMAGSAGTFGTTPAAVAAMVTPTTTKFMDAAGLYVIQTSDKTYDTVNASDARSWISWY